MITVTFQAKDMADLRKQVSEILGFTTGPIQSEASAHTATTAGAAVDLNVKRGPGRPKKDTSAPAPVVLENQTEIPGPPMEVKAEVATPAQVAATIDPVQAGPVDVEAVKAAVKKLTEHRPGDKSTHDSIKRAVVVLGKFGATTIKELKPEQYSAFIAACQAA